MKKSDYDEFLKIYEKIKELPTLYGFNTDRGVELPTEFVKLQEKVDKDLMKIEKELNKAKKEYFNNLKSTLDSKFKSLCINLSKNNNDIIYVENMSHIPYWVFDDEEIVLSGIKIKNYFDVEKDGVKYYADLDISPHLDIDRSNHLKIDIEIALNLTKFGDEIEDPKLAEDIMNEFYSLFIEYCFDECSETSAIGSGSYLEFVYFFVEYNVDYTFTYIENYLSNILKYKED